MNTWVPPSWCSGSAQCGLTLLWQDPTYCKVPRLAYNWVTTAHRPYLHSSLGMEASLFFFKYATEKINKKWHSALQKPKLLQLLLGGRDDLNFFINSFVQTKLPPPLCFCIHSAGKFQPFLQFRHLCWNVHDNGPVTEKLQLTVLDYSMLTPQSQSFNYMTQQHEWAWYQTLQNDKCSSCSQGDNVTTRHLQTDTGERKVSPRRYLDQQSSKQPILPFVSSNTIT